MQFLNIQDRGQMLLYINSACHTAVPLKISRGLPILFFFAGGKVQTPHAVGFLIIINGKFSRIAGPVGRRDLENWCPVKYKAALILFLP